MDTGELTTTLQGLQAQFTSLEDPDIKASLQTLLNLVERLAGEHARLQEENQQLKDEINRLKGEHGNPKFAAKSRQKHDISSEKERRRAHASR